MGQKGSGGNWSQRNLGKECETCNLQSPLTMQLLITCYSSPEPPPLLNSYRSSILILLTLTLKVEAASSSVTWWQRTLVRGWAGVLVKGRVDCPICGRVVWCFDGLSFGVWMGGGSGEWASVLLGWTAPYAVPLRAAICTAIGGRTAGHAGSATTPRMPLHCAAFQTHLRESNSWTQSFSNYVSSK
jgi:hypothetical protein